MKKIQNNKQKKSGISKNFAWILAMVVLLGFALLATEPLWNQPWAANEKDDPALIAQGETLYVTNCQVCHGAKGVGQDVNQRMGGQRADGTYIAPALDGSAHAWHHPEAMLFKLIKEGSPVAESPMRGWAERMSDKEIRAVIAYFQSLWPKELLARYRKVQSQN